MIADDDNTTKACFYLLKPAAVNVHHLVPRPLSSRYIYLLWPVRFRIHVSTSQPEDQIWPITQLRMIPKQDTSSNCSCGLQSTWKEAEIAPLCPDTTQLHEWDPNMFHLCIFSIKTSWKMETWWHNNPKQKTLTSVTFSGMPETAGVTMETQSVSQ